MVEASTSGTPNWVDLSTPDVQAAARFYGDLLGWNVVTHSSPMGDYHIGSVDGHDVGGMMTAPPDQAGLPAMWTVLFTVADVDATVVAVEEHGGKVLEPAFDLPDARIAIVADPTGAMFGVISHARPTGPWLSERPGAVCWVELLTRDPATAIGFYADVFGWDATTERAGEVDYTVFDLDGEQVGGTMLMPDEVPMEAPAQWAVYFAVADCAAAERRAEELGGQVVKPTTPMSHGRFAVLADPQGGTFQIMDQQR